MPIGSIALFMGILPEFEEEYGMKLYSFGHAGDGNFHLNITAESREDIPMVEEGIKAILEKVLHTKGTISGTCPLRSPRKAFVSIGESMR